MSDQTKLEPDIAAWLRRVRKFATHVDLVLALSAGADEIERLLSKCVAEKEAADCAMEEAVRLRSSPGWHEAIEEAAAHTDRMAESYQSEAGAWFTEIPDKLKYGYQASVLRYMAKCIRSLLPPGGEGLKK